VVVGAGVGVVVGAGVGAGVATGVFEARVVAEVKVLVPLFSVMAGPVVPLVLMVE
jgi:hypothetical protein